MNKPFMKYAYHTDIGKRLRNEDHFHVPTTGDSVPFVAVADGMGGHAAGFRASELAIEGLCELLQEDVLLNPVGQLRRIVQKVNQTIYLHAHTEDGCRSMGTTLTLALLLDGRYIAVNVGDSRLYHYDGTTLEQITVDHSLVAILVENGEITQEEAYHHPQRNIITRALGTRAYETIDVFDKTWDAGDLLLLCSDGLHGTLTDEHIRGVLDCGLSLEQTCELLIERSLRAGATDNITVVLAQYEGGTSA